MKSIDPGHFVLFHSSLSFTKSHASSPVTDCIELLSSDIPVIHVKEFQRSLNRQSDVRSQAGSTLDRKFNLQINKISKLTPKTTRGWSFTCRYRGWSFVCRYRGWSFMCRYRGWLFVCRYRGWSFTCRYRGWSFVCRYRGWSFMCRYRGWSFVCWYLCINIRCADNVPFMFLLCIIFCHYETCNKICIANKSSAIRRNANRPRSWIRPSPHRPPPPIRLPYTDPTGFLRSGGPPVPPHRPPLSARHGHSTIIGTGFRWHPRRLPMPFQPKCRRLGIFRNIGDWNSNESVRIVYAEISLYSSFIPHFYLRMAAPLAAGRLRPTLHHCQPRRDISSRS